MNILTPLFFGKIKQKKAANLALSGTNQGVNTAKINGDDVITQKILQSETYSAIQGRTQAAIVKKIAMDILATNVRHLGPTYSKTEIITKKKLYSYYKTSKLNIRKKKH